MRGREMRCASRAACYSRGQHHRHHHYHRRHAINVIGNSGAATSSSCYSAGHVRSRPGDKRACERNDKIEGITRRRSVNRSKNKVRMVVFCATAKETDELGIVKKKKAIVVLPGLGNNSSDYDPMCSLLRTVYQHDVRVIKVERYDWLRNASGALTPDYWRGTLRPRPTVDWYLERIDDSIQSLDLTTSMETDVVLLAHSAGGWLGRVWMKENDGHSKVNKYISLGSPQLAPPKGVLDQTRGILNYVNNESPGAFHDNVEYVTICGKWKQGAETFSVEGFEQWFVGLTYKQTCGNSTAWGDGITPCEIAHLDGSERIEIEGCYHSPIGARVDDSNVDVNRPWYGSESILKKWQQYI